MVAAYLLKYQMANSEWEKDKLRNKKMGQLRWTYLLSRSAKKLRNKKTWAPNRKFGACRKKRVIFSNWPSLRR